MPGGPVRTVLTVVVHKKEAQLVVDNFDKLVVVLGNLVRVGSASFKTIRGYSANKQLSYPSFGKGGGDFGKIYKKNHWFN